MHPLGNCTQPCIKIHTYFYLQHANLLSVVGQKINLSWPSRSIQMNATTQPDGRPIKP